MPTAAITISIAPIAVPDQWPAPYAGAIARRKFFELADIAGNVRKGKPAHEISPVALEAVKRIDALFDFERGINGKSAGKRLAARQEHARPLVAELHGWLTAQRAQMSRHNPVAKAINYMLGKEGRREAFTRFLDDGRICLTNNAAERALRGIARRVSLCTPFVKCMKTLEACPRQHRATGDLSGQSPL
ncbi:transposase IS66 family protein [Phyllobacterium leguminum]|uniref:Transposase IS66 family protein n=1 Tax=Phyllobacterium leguminum TaxID=314237 RepID=A0A318T2N0_9HYPH|nr:transposase IS66 family protein [Phyllobacterium leguminum]